MQTWSRHVNLCTHKYTLIIKFSNFFINPTPYKTHIIYFLIVHLVSTFHLHVVCLNLYLLQINWTVAGYLLIQFVTYLPTTQSFSNGHKKLGYPICITFYWLCNKTTFFLYFFLSQFLLQAFCAINISKTFIFLLRNKVYSASLLVGTSSK